MRWYKVRLFSCYTLNTWRGRAIRHHTTDCCRSLAFHPYLRKLGHAQHICAACDRQEEVVLEVRRQLRHDVRELAARDLLHSSLKRLQQWVRDVRSNSVASVRQHGADEPIQLPELPVCGYGLEVDSRTSYEPAVRERRSLIDR
jgi:hypothetical protein